ncbi:MAG: hypothetical protein U0168_30720 [Nannocystaceae bacterium]
MSLAIAFVGLVGVLQGLAWLGRGRRRALASTLVCLGLIALCLGVVHARVPGFFGD